MEFQVTKYQAPVIEINFYELKAELEKNLKDYTGLVVTEETLKGCKSAQKELAAVRTNINRYRIDKKKDLSMPINDFEKKCKELVDLIKKVEQPIKDGIQVYDDKKRDEKRVAAEKIIAEVAKETGLNAEYAKRLTVLDKYLNLSGSKKAVQEDVETRAFALKVEQDREQERLNIIQETISLENERLNTKLSLDDFTFLVNNGYPTHQIIGEIKSRANKIYAAENAPKEPPKPEVPKPEVEPSKQEPPKPEVEPSKQETPKPEAAQYTATFKVVGSADQLRSVSNFLRENGITYKVLEQKK